MTPQEAYTEDVRREPLYHDKTPRPPWASLPEHVKETWRRNPTPRGEPDHRYTDVENA